MPWDEDYANTSLRIHELSSAAPTPQRVLELFILVCQSRRITPVLVDGHWRGPSDAWSVWQWLCEKYDEYRPIFESVQERTGKSLDPRLCLPPLLDELERRLAEYLIDLEHAQKVIAALAPASAQRAQPEANAVAPDAAEQRRQREAPCSGVDGHLLDAVRRILGGLSETEPRKLSHVAVLAAREHGTVRDWSRRLQEAGFIEKRRNRLFVLTRRGADVLAEPE